MKVLHINCNYIGTALHQKMVEHLDAIGVQSKVFAPTYDSNLAVIKVNDNVTVKECFKKWDRVLFDYKQKKIIKCLEETYDIKQFDCIHSYTLFTDGNSANKLSKKYGIPYVVAIRNTDVNAFMKYMVHLRSRGVRIMRDSSAVFFLSEEYRKQVFDNYVPERYKEELLKKSHIIPNGIDDFWLDNLYTEKDINTSVSCFAEKKVKILYVGRINKRKNISLTLDAIEILKGKGWNVEFTVVGKVEDKDEYEKIRNAGCCTYLEARPKEQLLDIYRGNDLFVMPSHTETFGLVYAEALSQGLPVVYTKGQGFDGQFKDGVVGYATSDVSAVDLADKILLVIENYNEIQQRCAEVSCNFNWDKIVCGYGKIYDSVVYRKESR